MREAEQELKKSQRQAATDQQRQGDQARLAQDHGEDRAAAGAEGAQDRGTHRPDTTIRRSMDDSLIAYDERGLVPCVIQDWRSGEVLTLAYMNAEALAATRRTGELHLWSRSRGELWKKGETSGNTLGVRSVWVDCDADTLIYLVDPAGPSCHTGAETCFADDGDTPAQGFAGLESLWSVIAGRRDLTARDLVIEGQH